MLLYVAFGIVLSGMVYVLRKYMKRSRCILTNRIDGKHVLITGCNTGVGYETALELAKRGGIIHMACRNSRKCLTAKLKLMNQIKCHENQLICYQLDLASFKSITSFCENFMIVGNGGLDILINNAGVMMCPFSETEDNFEMQMGTNYIGHFLLTKLLLDSGKIKQKSRIINLSSLAHQHTSLQNLDLFVSKDDYNSHTAYCKSKLANVLHARHLTKLLADQEIAVVSLHPGIVNTELSRYLNKSIQLLIHSVSWILVKTPNEGCQTTLHCALDPNLLKYSGEYFSDCQVKHSPNSEIYDDSLAEKLYELTLKIVQHKSF